MAFPVILARATDVSSVIEDLNITVPSGVLQGELLYIIITRASGVSNPSGNLDWAETGTMGWDRQFYREEAGSVGLWFATKVANGDEGGTVLVEPADDLFGLVECGRISGADLNRGVEFSTTEGATGAVDPPNLIPSWGALDTLWIAAAAIDDTDGVTGGDGTFTAGTSLDNNSSSGAVQVTATREFNAASLSPAAWTNTGNEEWVAATIGIPPAAGPPAYPTIVRHDQRNGINLSTQDHTITIPSGTNRAIFIFVNGTVTSMTFDPSGINVAMSVATDGVTNAFANHASEGADGRWYTMSPASIPAAGDYIVRRVGNAGFTLTSVVVVNAPQTLQVAHVANSIVSGETIASVVPSGGALILYGCTRLYSGGVTGEGDPWTTFTSDGVRMMPYGSVYNAEGGSGSGYATIFARGYTTSGTINGVITSGGSQGVSALVLAYYQPQNDYVDDVPEAITLSEDLEVVMPFDVIGASSLAFTQVRIDFSSAVSLSNPDNFLTSSYSIPGLTVLGVSLHPTLPNSIVLTTGAQDSITYTVTVSTDVEGFGGDPLNPLLASADFSGFGLAASFTAAAQASQKVQLIFSAEMAIDAEFTDPANYTLTKIDGTPVSIVSADVTGTENRHAELVLGDELISGCHYSVTVGAAIRTADDQVVAPDSTLFRWLQDTRSPITLGFEVFSGEVSGGLLGQPAGQVFFSPALEQLAANSVLEVDQVSVCTRAYDTYEFPEPVDPPILFTFPAPSSPQASSLLNGTTILFASAERQGLARINLQDYPEDTYTPPVDGPADATLVETIDITRASFLNDPRWETFPAATATLGAFMTADNTTPIGPGPTVNINLQP